MTGLRPLPRHVYVSMPRCEWLVRARGFTTYQAHIEYHRIGCDPVLRYHLLVRIRLHRQHWWLR
jgi:hypothetical protein